ncbi:MAG: hypothetical protein AABY01_04755, partial [Nanoarchaeota archaeon]
IGDNELARRSGGDVSLTGTIEDESHFFEQAPMIGSLTIGDAVIGGRKRLRAGDTVPLVWHDRNVNQTVQVVALTRRSGTNAIDLVFDYFPWRRKSLVKQLETSLRDAMRAFNQKLDSRDFVFSLSGTTAATIPFATRGFYKVMHIRITSASWGGQTVTVTIDGTDRTTALFGAATVGANASADDTAYLVLSGDHLITLTPSGTVAVTVSLSAGMLG